MNTITNEQFKSVLSDFVKVSEELECPNCGKTTKLVGETRDNGNWFCPWCLSFFPYGSNTDIKTAIPFIKFTEQLDTIAPMAVGPLGDPPAADFPMDTTTGFLVPSYSYKFKRKRRVLLAEMDDFTRVGRIKSGSIWAFDLVFNDRPIAEYEALVESLDVQGYHLPFNYHDMMRGSNHVCYYDSDASEFATTSFDLGSFSIRITEAA